MSRELARRVEKLTEQLATLTTRQVVAVVLELPECPAWAEPIGEGRCALVALGDAAGREAVLEALRAGETELPKTVLHVEYRRVASAFIADAVDGQDAAELLAVSPRGEGKSQASLGALLAHALVHQAHGHAWPVRWQIVGSSRVYLLVTVARSMSAEWWRGAWTLADDDRLARLTLDGSVLVECDLVGVEDESGVDRLRREVHCAWSDEPAAALGDQAAGITRQAWGIAFSSCRLQTHRRVGLLTSNAPTPRSWVWKRFVLSPEPGCKAYRIPRGERTTQEYRDALDRQLADAPDMHSRLALGEAAMPMKGQPVARGYRDAECVAPRPLEPALGVPFYLGWDAGLTPACVIAQPRDGRCWIYAAPFTDRGGTAELIELAVLPFLRAAAPWVLRQPRMLIHCLDPNMRTPSQHSLADSPERTLYTMLPGQTRLGPTRWAPRRDALAEAFRPGRSRLWISPGEDTEELRIALAGGWFYRAGPGGDVRGLEPDKSHPHSDLGDALNYVLCELWPAQDREERRRDARRDPPARSKTAFSVWDFGHEAPR
jgi:hypothetical protein